MLSEVEASLFDRRHARGEPMVLTYDPRYNIAYIRLRKKTAGVETIRVGDSLNIDMSPDGTIYGIELLNANEQLLAQDKGALVVVNESLGERQEIDLKR